MSTARLDAESSGRVLLSSCATPHRTPCRARSRWWLALVAAALPWLCAGPALADEAAPRLKFRGKGSVCMCSDATDEDAIARAFESRAAAAKGASGAKAADPGARADPGKDAESHKTRDAKRATAGAGRPADPAAPRTTAPAISPAPRSPQEQRP